MIGPPNTYTLRASLVAVLSLVAMGWSLEQAQAFERHQCIAASNFGVTIASERQGVIGAMDSYVVSDRGETEFREERITTNADGSRGYLFRELPETATKPQEFCVSLVLRNVEVSDHRHDGPATVRPYEFSEEDAIRQCDARREQMGETICGHHGTMIKNANADGYRLALQALAEDDSGVARSLFTILANPEAEQRYSLLITASEGATTALESGVNFGFSDPILAYFDQVRQ